MTQLNTELQVFSPELKRLISPIVQIEHTCFVAGDACFDITHHLEPSKRINPEDPKVPLYKEYHTEESLGMLHNYVAVLRKTFGRSDDVKHADFVPYIEKHRYFLRPGEGYVSEYLQRIDIEPKDVSLRNQWSLPEKDKFDFLVIADYNKGEVTQKLYDFLSTRTLNQIYVDTKRSDPTMFCDATIKMNSEEFERTKQYHSSFYRIIHTKGADGAELIYPRATRPDTAYVSLPGSGVNPVNVSGAGDVFFGTFIGAEQYLKLNEHDSLILATIAAGISIQYNYTYIPTLEEIFNVLRQKQFRVW